MKRFFSVFILVICMVGIGFGLNRNHSDSATSKKGLAARHNLKQNIKTPTTRTVKESTTSKKKKCACCRSTLETIKQKRKALELWAREMIETHGYEEGIKRVTAKSPTLAKRVLERLETEE